MATEQDKYLENGRFKVEIQGCEKSAEDCVMVNLDPWRIHVLDVTHGNDWDYRRIKPGACEHMTVEFQFRVKDDALNGDIKQWQEDCRKGVKDKTRKNLSVVLYDREGKEARRYNLLDCFCTFFDAGDYSTDSTANLSTMKINVGHVEFK